MADKDVSRQPNNLSSGESLSHTKRQKQDVPLSNIPSNANVSRRNFLASGAFAAATLALPRVAKANSESAWYEGAIAAADTSSCTATVTIPGEGTAFSNPKVWKTCEGKLTLDAEFVGVDGSGAGLGNCVKRRTYKSNVPGSRQIPGPTIEVSPGGKIEIDFTNNLPDDTAICKDNIPSCYNPSNIHFHGLHVSPKSTANGIASDNVGITVNPEGGQQSYCVELPKFHAPGTHWYHTHKHGSTAIQVEDGMLGALIVREPDEEHNMVPDDRDSVWMIQELLDGDVYTTRGLDVDAAFIVNGIYKPHIKISAKRMYRWRFINGTATPRGIMNLTMNADNTAIPLYRIAVDGISFYGHSPQKDTQFGLAPGNRSDFLIWVESPGTYTIEKASGTGGVGNPSTLATVEVIDDGFDDVEPSILTIPGQLPPYLSPITKAEVMDGDQARTQALQFDIFPSGAPEYAGLPGNKKPKVATINAQQYSASTCVEVTLNTAEIWALQDIGNKSMHPFHIHVNPFQVPGDMIDPSKPNDSSNWIWWDTIPVNPGDPGPIVPIIHRFNDYDGSFVLHCHILIHEDQGMMVNVHVKNDGNGTEACTPLLSPKVYPPQGPPITAAEVNQILVDFPPEVANPFPTCSASTGTH